MTPANSSARAERPERQPIPLPNGPENPACPKCGGRMWDNRASKQNPRAPDFKCRERTCDGVLWPGQHRTTIPATEPPRLTVVPKDATPSNAQGDGVGELLPLLRKKYLDLTDFAIRLVRPKYQEQALECGPETVAAIVATLYIAETRRDGL